ncbi:DUF1127 domain-containing protein [Endozoicomonas numazuensis]|uniref:YjiS-like domain-containing protein n=1 Tax=Endozoicomonas numazuensis TaxID=1137799 RepID=A0A081NGN2_9GAMM|nr:DUF1127 domain-containing protein [Endozoicomonas numazuensis]KEQ17605.1 hypothetical protein GZ78_17915 [Endozoicomonas numazuensis]
MKQNALRKMARLPMKLINQWDKWHHRSRTHEYLARMDSRMLKDIGVTEADRMDEISKPFWRE